MILNQTVFYAESGGQIGDVGEISNSNSLFEVMNTQKIFGDLFVHFGKLSKGSLKLVEICKNYLKIVFVSMRF